MSFKLILSAGIFKNKNMLINNDIWQEIASKKYFFAFPSVGLSALSKAAILAIFLNDLNMKNPQTNIGASHSLITDHKLKDIQISKQELKENPFTF